MKLAPEFLVLRILCKKEMDLSARNRMSVDFCLAEAPTAPQRHKNDIVKAFKDWI